MYTVIKICDYEFVTYNKELYYRNNVMADLPEKILLEIERHGSVKSSALAKLYDTDHQKIVGAIKSLECLDDMIEAEMESVKRWDLSKEGELVVEKGTNELSKVK